MCIVIVCFPGCDVINFEISLSILVKLFFYGSLYLLVPGPGPEFVFTSPGTQFASVGPSPSICVYLP